MSGPDRLDGVKSLADAEDESDERARTDLHPGAVAVSDAARSYVVHVSQGPDAGARFVIDGSSPSRVLVGTSPACDVRLTDSTVSRRHLALDTSEARLRCTDLGSTNGTRVGGLGVVDVFLEGGETIALGDTRLLVEREASRKVLLPSATHFGRVVGGSRQMRRLYGLAERVAGSNVPVIVEGETGTGKEALAEAIHERSPRADRPFVVVDCTAITPNLIEAELFGHERGAFTGAVSSRPGFFQEADTGTLFIDEIGDLDLALQAKLLRAIERNEVRPVGASKWVKVDVRIIAATRRDLDREVQQGRFRDDLFYRLAVARIELPPLRKREGDIELLSRHFWRELGGSSEDVPADLLARFAAYDWPGNVRELQNAVAKRLALGDERDVPPESTREPSLAAPHTLATDPIADIIKQGLPFPTARDRLLSEFERRYVEDVLARAGGNVGEAAKRSGLARRYFQIIRARQREP